MALKQTRFRVELLHPVPGAETVTHDVTVMPADRMRAERLSTAELPPSQRGPAAMGSHPETWVLLWLWCAAKRTGLTEAGFEAFADTVAAYDRVGADGVPLEDDDPGEAEGEPVDPTHGAAPTSLPSTSRPGSGASSSGSTPTVTPA